MLNQTQIQFVISQLENFGYVRRNLCLENRITRLGAIIHILKKKGLYHKDEIEGKYVEYDRGKDYWYIWKNFKVRQFKDVMPKNYDKSMPLKDELESELVPISKIIEEKNATQMPLVR